MVSQIPKKKVAIIGCGTMGQAILSGLLKSKTFDASEIIATVRTEESREKLQSLFPEVEFTTNNRLAIEAAEIIILCLKPHVLRQWKQPDKIVFSRKTIVSIIAGITLADLLEMSDHSNTLILRAMPNLPCRVQQGVTAIAFREEQEMQAKEIGTKLFESLGRVIFVDESQMDVVTALSGSGPAFVCMMIEALADGAVMMGLPRTTALTIATQMMQGTTKMILESGTHPAVLRESVCTPAGCTIAGLLTMEDGKVRSVLARTIEEATKVARGK